MRGYSVNLRSARAPALVLVAAAACLPAAAQDCETKIGALGPMSGGAAAWGLAMKSGAEFAAAQVNQAGGLQVGNRKCKVTVLNYDTKYTADGAAAGANYMASQNVKVIIGPSVLGGLVATVGDTVIDGSVRARLDQLKSRL